MPSLIKRLLYWTLMLSSFAAGGMIGAFAFFASAGEVWSRMDESYSPALTEAQAARVCARSAAAENESLSDDSALRIGDAYLRAGDTRLAIKSYRAVLARKGDSARLHNSLGIAHHAAWQIGRATVHYEKALELDPGFAPAYNNLGILYASRLEFDLARSAFREALALDPALVDAGVNYSLAAVSEIDLAYARAEASTEKQPSAPGEKPSRAVVISNGYRYEVAAGGRVQVAPLGVKQAR
ncbi:MAG: tetratricopeptide repeat protein [Bdellovibrionales bacterium]|nr:tetratricopeptide repeat protein [Bdellovibrionales bacterium]